MQKNLVLLLCTALLATACAASTSSAEQPQSAKAAFEEYQSLEHSFDPALADLYCDNALIRNTRKYPNGQTRTIEIPATKYKSIIRASLPAAKAAGDYSTYSNVAFAPDGSNVRITATRYSVSRKYSSPMTLLVGPCNGAAWSILEEIGESQP